VQHQLKSCQLLHRRMKKILFEKAKVIGMELLLFSRPYIIVVVCSNNVCILHRFQDITTFTVYVTACDFLDKSFTFDKTDVCTSGFTCKFIRAIFPKIWEAGRFQTTKVTLKVPRGLLASCHSIWQI